MNGFSVGELCWLFCCPACPSPVVAKLAFLPPEPTSTVQVSEQRGSGAPAPGLCRVHLRRGSAVRGKGRGAGSVQPAPDQARRLAVLAALAGRPLHAALLARQRVDLSQMCNFYIGLGSLINSWIAMYGRSPENIILYGQSMGTAPTVDLASRYECAAVILHSPLMSGWRVSFPDSRKTYYFDAFPGIDKISKELCPQAMEPPGVERAGHNDIELYAQYLGKIKLLRNFPIPEDDDLVLPL
ncbi:hypothetical protein FD754_016240 [Muntiacus muntjak]|uniref:Alpha/beta hydrolase domain-containing protein 17C n=1 Tax=Muntiacus muntjak TaxID=9888 RepID=A0A5N3VQJ7_MUNMU|nr:hypothetical protein FD754_016240 [Muntiacus muntjak]